MSKTNETIPHFYDPENFEEVCEAFSALIQRYLGEAVRGGEELPVLPAKKPAVVLKEWEGEFPEYGKGWREGLALVEKAVAGSIHIHHPHYMGHQVTGPLPMTILCDMVMSMLNNSSAVYEMGQVATALEMRLLKWVGSLIGFGDESGGILTSGGSLGNLTALLAARQVKTQGNVWVEGYSENQRPCILVSEQAHYCVKRAVQIMGMGNGGAILVATTPDFRMDMDALREAYANAIAEGKFPIAVVASACTTPTGTYDPLNAIADFCAEKDLWMHVDGAHGLASLLAPDYRHLLEGVDRADSVVWDLHKMMLMPSLITAVMYKDGSHAYQAFAQDASYLFNNPEMEAYNMGLRTFECTKPNYALKAYISLMSYGTKAFGDYIADCNNLAKWFAHALKEAPDFECATQPDCNIVCFRYRPEGVEGEALNEAQAFIRQRILNSGKYYLVQTNLRGNVYLRVTLLNPLTLQEDLESLMDLIRQYYAYGPIV